MSHDRIDEPAEREIGVRATRCSLVHARVLPVLLDPAVGHYGLSGVLRFYYREAVTIPAEFSHNGVGVGTADRLSGARPSAER